MKCAPSWLLILPVSLAVSGTPATAQEAEPAGRYDRGEGSLADKYREASEVLQDAKTRELLERLRRRIPRSPFIPAPTAPQASPEDGPDLTFKTVAEKFEKPGFDEELKPEHLTGNWRHVLIACAELRSAVYTASLNQRFSDKAAATIKDNVVDFRLVNTKALFSVRWDEGKFGNGSFMKEVERAWDLRCKPLDNDHLLCRMSWFETWETIYLGLRRVK